MSPAPRAVWNDLVGADPLALPTQTPGWTDAMVTCGFVDVSRAYAGPSGQRAVIPLVRRRRSPEVLARRASLPAAWGFGGVVTDSPGDEPFLAAVAADLARTRGVQTHLRPNPLRASAWDGAVGAGAVRLPSRAHVLDLRDGFDHWWGSVVSKGLRKKVRRAERQGVRVECGLGGDLVAEYHGLFERSIRRFAEQAGEPVWLAQLRARLRDPADKFRRLGAVLGPALRVYVAYHEGRPVAADVVLLGPNAHNTRGAMHKELAAPLRATLVIQQHAIRDACAAGARWYHMGESGTSANLAAFKEQFGARPRAYDQYRFERVPLTRADRALRGAVRRVLGVRDPA